METVFLTRRDPVSKGNSYVPVAQEITYTGDDYENGSRRVSSLQAGRDNEEEKVALSKRILPSKFLIHFVALAATGAVLQLSFRHVYWFDSGNWAGKWYFLMLGQDEIMNALQFAAKLHEIFIVGSLTAIVMHIVRRRLLGRGIPFGLLTSGYQASSVEFLFSKSMWASAFRTWSDFFFVVFLALVIIYASMVGPSSAIALIPNLDWWPVSNPFNGLPLTTYLTVNSSQLYPQRINPIAESLANQCQTFTMDPLCPNGGFDDLLVWAMSYANENEGANMSMVEQMGGTRRQLISQNASIATQNHLAADDQGNVVAIATTLHQSIIMMMGLFWNYVKTHPMGQINDISRPLLGFSDSSPVRSPLVQVQCSWYDYGDVLNQTSTAAEGVFFPTRALNNFTTPYYADMTDGWAVHQSLYNSSGPGNATNFTWIDLSSSYGGASLGAMVILPYLIGYDNGVAQASWVLPCTIDARWIDSELSFDPNNNDLVESNITTPSDFSPLNDNAGASSDSWTSQGPSWGVSNAIVIDTAWADLLNAPGIVVSSAGSADFNTTMMQSLLLQFTTNHTFNGTSPFLETGASYSLFEAPYYSFIGNTSVNTSTAGAAAAVTVESILAMTIAEGLSRSTYYEAFPFLILNDDPNDIKSDYIAVQTGPSSGGVVDHTNAAKLREWTSFTFTVQRYGYGYAWTESRTVQFGLTVLMIYVVIAVLYIGYSFFYWNVPPCARTGKKGWQSGSWGEAGEMIALALVTPAHGARRVLGNVGAGVEKLTTWKKTVRIAEGPGGRLEMVVDSDLPSRSGGREPYANAVVVGKKYR